MVQHNSIDHSGLLTVSYASNSTTVSLTSAAGASTLVSRADHVHTGTSLPWTSGTSMPYGPATNQRVTRTDLGMDFYWDGTRWLSTTIYKVELRQEDTLTWPLTANATVVHRGVPPFNGAYDIYMLNWEWQSAVLTTNTGSAYWTVTLRKYPVPTGASTVLITANTSADTADSTYQKISAINALLGAFGGFFTDSNKTSTPGNHRFMGGHITCRIVGT